MLLQRHAVLLEGLPTDATDEAEAFFVVLDAVAAVTLTCERIDHDAGDDVADQLLREDHVDEVKGKPERVEDELIIVDFLAEI